MRWLWVSRDRYDDLQRRLEASETERIKLMEFCLEKKAQPVPVQESEPQGNFSTPIDRILSRFDEAHKNGKKINSRFKVRVS